MKKLLLLLSMIASVTLVAAAPAPVKTPAAPVHKASLASAALAWVAPTLNVDGTTISGAITYNIYQGAAGAEVQVQTGVTATAATISAGLTPGSTVCWQVTAVVAAQESTRGNEACKTFALPVPAAPTGLTVT